MGRPFKKDNHGIYRILNRINGKCYYGSTNNFTKRRLSHWLKLRANKHENPHLQSAWNKYGEAAFVFEIVKVVPSHLLLDAEQPFLDSNTDGYNIARCAQSPGKGHRHTEEFKKKKRDFRHTPEAIEKIRAANLARDCGANSRGRKHSREEVLRRSQSFMLRSRGVSLTQTGRWHVRVLRKGYGCHATELEALAVADKVKRRLMCWQL